MTSFNSPTTETDAPAEPVLDDDASIDSSRRSTMTSRSAIRRALHPSEPAPR